MTDAATAASAASARPPRGLSYNQVRILLLVGGLVLLGITAGVNYVRRVETAEVAAILFFIPIFVAFVFWDWKGGLIAALGAIAGYVALRYGAIHALGSGRFISLIFSRSIAFLAFGAIGGLANQELKGSLTKLDLYDQIDDATGLFNARYFLQDTDLEMSRSRRYQTIFSVTVVDIPAEPLDQMGWRRRRNVLRQLGRLLRDSVRTVDRPVHSRDSDRHRVAVVLPETSAEGARIFTDRLAARMGELFSTTVESQAISFPDDEAALQVVRAEFAEVERREHPEHPEPVTPPPPARPDGTDRRNS
jgi:GGDEF domain-containing protein